MHHNITFLSGMIVQNYLGLKMFASTLFNCCTVHVEYVLNMFAHGSACSNCLVKTEVFPLLHQSESICEQIQTNQSINNNNNLSLLLSMLVPVCSCGQSDIFRCESLAKQPTIFNLQTLCELFRLALLLLHCFKDRLQLSVCVP